MVVFLLFLPLISVGLGAVFGKGLIKKGENVSLLESCRMRGIAGQLLEDGLRSWAVDISLSIAVRWHRWCSVLEGSGMVR